MSSEYRQRYANKILAEEIVSGIIARKKAAELVAPLSGMEDVSGVASQLCRMLSAMPADYCDDFVAQLQELPCPLSVCVLAEFDPTEIASDADVASDVAATSWDGVTFEHA